MSAARKKYRYPGCGSLFSVSRCAISVRRICAKNITSSENRSSHRSETDNAPPSFRPAERLYIAHKVVLLPIAHPVLRLWHILKQSGVYFLFGTDKTDNAVVYIGQAGAKVFFCGCRRPITPLTIGRRQSCSLRQITLSDQRR